MFDLIKTISGTMMGQIICTLNNIITGKQINVLFTYFGCNLQNTYKMNKVLCTFFEQMIRSNAM